ncbi:molybdate ABC transporter substrate-binding protein [bacterium]|nr:molybdate ABC transporter substrate-binding protein [bacterium]
MTLRRIPLLTFVCLAVATLAISCGKPKPPRTELTVATAANFAPTMEKLAGAYEPENNVQIVISQGSSGVLQRQAKEGAPFDLLISADMRRVEELAADQVILPESVAPYAKGILVLAQTRGPEVDKPAGLAHSGHRIAIANPEHAPYGTAAKQALTKMGIWEDVEPRVVYGESVGQVLQFLETGNVDVAFLPLSLVKDRIEEFTPIDPETYDPILQGLGVIAATTHPEKAQELRDWLLGPEAQNIILAAGYEAP